jgi:hypothetical protein
MMLAQTAAVFRPFQVTLRTPQKDINRCQLERQHQSRRYTVQRAGLSGLAPVGLLMNFVKGET